MITATALRKQYKTETNQIVHALNNVSFTVESGDFFVLLGPSGSGKTTTLRSVAGIETADSGTISIGSNTVFCTNNALNTPAEERPIAMVFQSYALWPHMDVYNNIVFPLRKGVRRVNAAEIKRRVETVSDTLKLTPYLRRPISKLSGGQQQRVALARALALEPDVLLMDEPLSNLDAKLRTQLRVEIKNLTRSLGITTLYVTHDQVEAMVMGDQIAVMSEGAIAEHGTPEQLYKRPKNKFVAKFLGEMNFVSGVLGESDGRQTVNTPLGCVFLQEQESRPIGSTISLGFRPEDVQITDASDSTALRARVIQSHYIGDALLCELNVPGCDFSARLPNVAQCSVGDAPYISIPSNAFIAFADDDSTDASQIQ